jgi:hypothetical protein
MNIGDVQISSALQLLGSVASLAAIPLAIYLYLRSKEAQNARLRREVVRSLSYQIGEGRILSLFEVISVIQSKSRDQGVRGGIPPISEIIEDLVTDTIGNPMLDSEGKVRIVANLQALHSNSALYRILDATDLDLQTVARRLAAEDVTKEEAAPQAFPESTSMSPHYSTLFGLFSVAAISLLYLLSQSVELKGLDFLKDPMRNIAIGLASSVLGAVFVFLVSKVLDRLGPASTEKKREKQQ